MRRRFGRGRRGGRAPAEGGRGPIDAVRWLGRLSEEGVVAAGALEPVVEDDLPASFAVVGRGQDESGTARLVGFAPGCGGDAALAALAVGRRLAEAEGFAGEVIAVAPQWDGASRRRLRAVGEQPFAFQPRQNGALFSGQLNGDLCFRDTDLHEDWRPWMRR